MRIDYHIHTDHSWDASGSMEEYCLKAIELGVDEIGFSDHLDLDPMDRACGFHNCERIDRAFRQVQSMFDDSVQVKKGIEITYQEEYHNQIEEIVNSWDYDYTMAGIHLSKGVFFTSRLAEEHYAKFPDPKSAFQFYFDELMRAIESGLIDIVAHMDVIKRHSEKVFGPFKPEDFSIEFDAILNTMIERNIALEINTGDIANFNRNRVYPSDWIINRFRELGGDRITFGSDSHNPGVLSGGYETARRKAIRFGFNGWCVYKNRVGRIEPFDNVK